MARRQKAKIPTKTPEQYGQRQNPDDAYRNALVGRATKQVLMSTRQKWQQYCDLLSILNSDEHLRKASLQTFCAFMDWMIDNNHISKVSTVRKVYGKIQMLYKWTVARSIDPIINDAVHSYITNELRIDHNLTSEMQEKPLLTAKDLKAVLKYHWVEDSHRFTLERQRVQLGFMALLCAYSTSRPGGIVESSCPGLTKTGEALKWKDVELYKGEHPDKAKGTVLFFKLTLRLMKGRRAEDGGEHQPVKIVLSECNDCLALCPVLHLLSIALADEAIVGYQTAKQIYDAPLRNGTDPIRYRWKSSVEDLPILRRDTWGKLEKSPARYGTISTHWRRLIQEAGFQEPASWYALRRSAGNEINVIAPQSIRMQAMGHSNPRMFQKHYQSQVVMWDTQNTYLRAPLEPELIHMASNSNSLNRDPRAPKKLTPKQENELVNNNHEVVEKLKQREQLANECVRKYGTIQNANAKQSDVWKKYQTAHNEYVAEQRYHRKEALQKLREAFFDNNSVESLERSESLDTENRLQIYSLPDRESLVQLLFLESGTKEETSARRIAATEHMHAICNKIEPTPKKMPQKSSKRPSGDLRKNKYSLRCDPKTCLFCLGKTGTRVLSTRVRLGRHLEKTHYPYVRGKIFECPHPHCKDRMQHIQHFQVHAMQVHGIEFTKKCGLSPQQPLDQICEHLRLD